MSPGSKYPSTRLAWTNFGNFSRSGLSTFKIRDLSPEFIAKKKIKLFNAQEQNEDSLIVNQTKIVDVCK